MNQNHFKKIGWLFAASPTGYVLLEPGVIGKSGNAVTVTFIEYVQAFYKQAIVVGAFLGVMMLVFAGVQYILSFGPGSKEKAKAQWQAAIIGLAILILIYLILETINPQLINLDLIIPPLSK